MVRLFVSTRFVVVGVDSRLILSVEELVEDDFAPSSKSRTKRKTRRKRRVVKAEESSVSIDINEDGEHGTQRILSDPKPPKSSKAKAKATPKPKGKTKPKPKAYDPTTFLPRISSPWKVGAHVSAAGGVENAVVNAAMIGYVPPSFLFSSCLS